MRHERRLGFETEGRRLHARADSALSELLWSGLVCGMCVYTSHSLGCIGEVCVALSLYSSYVLFKGVG